MDRVPINVASLLLFVSLCWAAPSFAAVSVTLGQNFQGSSLGVESTSTPSDCNGTIGPNHFVEFINGTFAVYNRTNGLRVFLSTDVSFWQNAGLPLDSNAFVSDPRLIFDPVSGRWFACQIDVPVSGINNRFLLAVSKTSDPTAGWRAVTIPSDPDRFSDFPPWVSMQMPSIWQPILFNPPTVTLVKLLPASPRLICSGRSWTFLTAAPPRIFSRTAI